MGFLCVMTFVSFSSGPFGRPTNAVNINPVAGSYDLAERFACELIGARLGLSRHEPVFPVIVGDFPKYQPLGTEMTNNLIIIVVCLIVTPR